MYFYLYMGTMTEILTMGRYTVESHYLEAQGTLKYFEISVPRHIKFAELRKKIIDHISQMNM